jgi:hypothetical protein
VDLSIKVEPNNFFDWSLWNGATVPFSQRATGSPQAQQRRSALFQPIGDFLDWKPILEIEAFKLRGCDGIPSEFVTRVKRRVVRNVRDFAVHDVGTSLGMFVAGSVITSNTETRLDYEDDPDDAPKIERRDPLEMV